MLGIVLTMFYYTHVQSVTQSLHNLDWISEILLTTCTCDYTEEYVLRKIARWIKWDIDHILFYEYLCM